jgi:hypothetical protein
MTKTGIFTKDDYNSGDGIVTSVFGPIIWNHLHLISFNYPVNPTAQDKDIYKNMLLYTGKTLPCRACRDNFTNNLEKAGFNDAVFDNRETYSKFIYKLHNCVNKMLGKPITLTYSQVRDRYENFRARCIDGVPAVSKHKENGCVDSLYGKKSKCVIQIVPTTTKTDSFIIDHKCVVQRVKRNKKRSKSKSRK